MTEEVAILDFETTGLRVGIDRPTEIAIAIVRDGRVISRYESLMNPEVPIPESIQVKTGITDEMVADAATISQVMREARGFVSSRSIVAHNASFDARIWNFELKRLNLSVSNDFACTMLLSRRLYPNLGQYTLGAMVKDLQLEGNHGQAHRAMADVLTTADLFNRILVDIRSTFGLTDINHALLREIQVRPKDDVNNFLRKIANKKNL